IVSLLILIIPWWSEIIVRMIAKQITVTLRLVRVTTLKAPASSLNATIFGSEEEVIELDDSFCWDEIPHKPQENTKFPLSGFGSYPRFGQFMKMNNASSSGSGTLPSNTITNPKEDLKGITTQSRNAYKGPTIPTTSSPSKVLEREIKVTRYTKPPTNNGSTKDVQPLVVQVENQMPNSEPVVALVVEPVVAPVSAPKQKLSIPYPSRLHDQKLCNKNRNQGNNHGIPQGNNQGRNQFFHGASHGPNPPPAYQASGYQAPIHQALIPQPQVVTATEFTNYMKVNNAILKNMQTSMTSLTNSNLELKNRFGQFMKMNNASSSGSGTLPSNTITNPKEDLKGITTQSRNAYKGPTIPTTSSPSKVLEREIKVTRYTKPPTNNGSTKDVQPLVVQV
nr:reverse transcriptase domain-containing protein [Tanacetum cinerariifolium]